MWSVYLDRVSTLEAVAALLTELDETDTVIKALLNNMKVEYTPLQVLGLSLPTSLAL